MKEIDNNQDIIDSRDIIDRIEELEAEIDEAEADQELEDEKEELAALKDLEKEVSSSPDWSYGEVLIHEGYFTDYCEELCKEIGDIPGKLPWYIENHIDWEGVAREIKQDYIEVDFDGISYYIRA